MPVFQLSDSLLFPPPALAREDGLLAVGGDLSVARLLLAYQDGIFPWYSRGEPILWWSPNPRLVLFPEEFHLSKRLGRTIRQQIFTLTFDTDFSGVINQCAHLRLEEGDGTWLSAEMVEAYQNLHDLGHAHSVECWQEGKLVGGLYGVSLGAVFFGESMFSLVRDSSKVALAGLVDRLQGWDFELIDCQVGTGHLQRLGAREIPGEEFSRRLARAVARPGRQGKWSTA
ncbi:MAG: leucyl/phenylalanyl-tRNA--protein transferase [Desulfurivibrionaceae bacterium]|jgi:leucyl/phenylalanyl-tRNA--protein transferase|nr:leucyl/phenylalanyl-tRNA--protein transferase [Pseudomonadota bacterium]MCG2824750.1 leucyl/phenylalanyl-tRNA--protein transferase [Desulfobulbaceae bacterium]MDP2003619.1 leucyl/phenylalanyl-tRNA--protein transferase [Desulfurivibrionaceae bacterium]MBU4407551.1 leucyl/phenylalanyl-tRNA--protein transferase [Pseudomonadota bacterium]MBU4412798.1 leucyl/phenylalanyl-tRNA--protein transferase [Pseudomonadota bacterium]